MELVREKTRIKREKELKDSIIKEIMKNKVDPPPASLQPKNSKSLTTSIATRANIENYFNSGLSGVLSNPDPILKALGKDQSAYDDILNDGALYQNIGSRKAGTIKREWEIVQRDCPTNIYEVIVEIFSRLRIKRTINQILNCTSFGYNVLEVLYEFTGKYWYPCLIEEKPREWFVYDENDNSLMIKAKDVDDYKKVPPYKFLNPRYDDSYDNPYGTPLLGKCYWNAMFRREGKKFWITFVEKYGMPFVQGTFNIESLKQFYAVDDNATAAVCLKDDLDILVQDGIIVNSEGIDLKVIAPGEKGDSNYSNLLYYCKEENAETILGHTGTAMSTPGKLGSEKAAIEVRQDIVLSDSAIVEEAFDTLIEWIFELNFNDVERPKFKFLDSEKALNDFAKRDLDLTNTGIKLLAPHYIKTYHFDEDEFEIVGTPAPSSNTTKDSTALALFNTIQNAALPQDEKTLKEFTALFLDGKMQNEMMSKILKPVIDFVNGAKSYEDMAKNYVNLFDEMPTKDFEDQMDLLQLIVRAYGFDQINDETEAQIKKDKSQGAK